MIYTIKVIVPDVLQSYTGGREVKARGSAILDLFDDLETQFPGIRFRVINELNLLRPNFKLFINGVLEKNLTAPVGEADELFIMQALSGG